MYPVLLSAPVLRYVLISLEGGTIAPSSVSIIFILHLSLSLFSFQSIKKWMGEEKIKTFVNFCLRYIADLNIPKKRSLRN